MESLRAFAAIELNEALRNSLRRLQRELKSVPGAQAVRWVAPENTHLTVKFLGNIDTQRLEEFNAALARVGLDFSPMNLVVRGLGCFPNTRRPSVVWVGVEGDVAPLTRLAAEVDNAFELLGIAHEARPFSPHLTLGRIRRDARPADSANFGEAVKGYPPVEMGAIEADAIVLFRSELRPSGPVYSVLDKATLSRAREVETKNLSQ